MSPNTARWQQQINSSFEALINGASRCSPSHYHADCSDWRYAVDDLRSVRPTVDDLRREDWSLRHLEQRSDSRDSGLESDVAADRHAVCAARKCFAGDHSSLQATFSLQQRQPLKTGLFQIDAITAADSPAPLRDSIDMENYHLYGVFNKKKLHATLKVRPRDRVELLTNGFAGHQHTPDSSGTIVR